MTNLGMVREVLILLVVYVQNLKSVLHFVLVNFGGVLVVVVIVTGGKQSQLLVRLGLSC